MKSERYRVQKKKILLLGASPAQIPPILYAKERGYHVITCDNIPSNAGHEYADESFDVSTTNKEGVLRLASEKIVDAVVAYASDPAAPTAAYVGNKMSLVSNPYDSVCTLVDKSRYRKFLRDHDFNFPKFIHAKTAEDASLRINDLEFPLMVKPADSSGSKGVTRIASPGDLASAFDYAIGFSKSKIVVIEEHLQREGPQIAGDAFIVGGRIAFHALANEHFNENCNPFVPIGESFPSTVDPSVQSKVIQEIDRLIHLLEMRSGAINIDAIIDRNGEVYLMEIGPRNGGNLIPEVIRYCTGVDLIAYTIESALGRDCSGLKHTTPMGCFSSYIIHSEGEGIFEELLIENLLQDKIVEMNLHVEPGRKVHPFNGSQFGLGSMILRFDSMGEMLRTMKDLPQIVRVKLEGMP